MKKIDLTHHSLIQDAVNRFIYSIEHIERNPLLFLYSAWFLTSAVNAHYEDNQLILEGSDDYGYICEDLFADKNISITKDAAIIYSQLSYSFFSYYGKYSDQHAGIFQFVEMDEESLDVILEYPKKIRALYGAIGVIITGVAQSFVIVDSEESITDIHLVAEKLPLDFTWIKILIDKIQETVYGPNIHNIIKSFIYSLGNHLISSSDVQVLQDSLFIHPIYLHLINSFSQKVMDFDTYLNNINFTFFEARDKFSNKLIDIMENHILLINIYQISARKLNNENIHPTNHLYLTLLQQYLDRIQTSTHEIDIMLLGFISQLYKYHNIISQHYNHANEFKLVELLLRKVNNLLLNDDMHPIQKLCILIKLITQEFQGCSPSLELIFKDFILATSHFINNCQSFVNKFLLNNILIPVHHLRKPEKTAPDKSTQMNPQNATTISSIYTFFTQFFGEYDIGLDITSGRKP